MVIITGPRVQLSISLIDRMKKLFYPSVVFDSKETVIELNKVRIEAFPSHSIESARGLPNVSFILADESDFWNQSEEQDVRAVIERYGPKSQPFTVLTSTANRPDGLMDTIRKEPEETCLYKRLFMDYHVALGKLFTSEEIELARKSPSFESEFCLKFQGQIGNLISQLAIDKAVELGRLYDPDKDYNPTARHCIGIDCAFGGSSNFSITVLQAQAGKIQVLYSQEFSRPDYDQMLHHVIALMKQYHKVYTVRVDAANPEFIASLKVMLGEKRDFTEHIATLKKQNPHTPIERFMRVIPVSFNIENRRMLSLLKAFVEDDRGLLQINPRFTELIMSLRSAVAEETSLIKKESLYNDSLDSMRLAISYFTYQPEGASK
jgi:hypothetical protein